MQVYVANLGKYNEGELVGAWFTRTTVYRHRTSTLEELRKMMEEE